MKEYKAFQDTFIKPCRAEGLVSSVLLHGWLRPSAKRGVIAHGEGEVPMCVPQWKAGELRGAAHDRRPLAGRRVDAHGDSQGVALIYHSLQEVDVISSAAGPVLRQKKGPMINTNKMNIHIYYRGAFDIEPEHAVSYTHSAVLWGVWKGAGLGGLDLVRLEVVDSVRHLLLRVTAAVAREDIAVNVSHPGVPSVVDVRGTIGIRRTIRAVNADNGEFIY